MVEGTPLLRVHLGKTWIQGSNPCVSASNNIQAHDSVGFFVFTAFTTINSTINYRPGWRLPPSHQRRLSAFCETDSSVVEKVIETHSQPSELAHHSRQRRIDEIVVLGV